jgi:hypothetical protein
MGMHLVSHYGETRTSGCCRQFRILGLESICFLIADCRNKIFAGSFLQCRSGRSQSPRWFRCFCWIAALRRWKAERVMGFYPGFYFDFLMTVARPQITQHHQTSWLMIVCSFTHVFILLADYKKHQPQQCAFLVSSTLLIVTRRTK